MPFPPESPTPTFPYQIEARIGATWAAPSSWPAPYDATLEAWHSAELGSAGRFTFGVEETFTKYEDFVRVGPRRGFHLLLVQETDEGFTPILS